MGKRIGRALDHNWIADFEYSLMVVYVAWIEVMVPAVVFLHVGQGVDQGLN